MGDERQIDPQFDGHLERPFTEWSAEEKLAWLWSTMQLVRSAHRRSEGGRDPGPAVAGWAAPRSR